GRRARRRARPRAGPGRRGRIVLDSVARPPRARDPAESRTPRHRARVLERALAERDLGTSRDPARHRQDPYTERPGATRACTGGGAARTPDFAALAGRDIDPGERARLERVHDLLVAAGPPPEPAAAVVVPLRPRRRRGALLALAAALAVAAFAI